MVKFLICWILCIGVCFAVDMMTPGVLHDRNFYVSMFMVYVAGMLVATIVMEK